MLDEVFIYHTPAGIFLEYDLKEFAKNHPDINFSEWNQFSKIIFNDIVEKIDVNYKDSISLSHEEFLCFVSLIFIQTSSAIENYFKKNN